MLDIFCSINILNYALAGIKDGHIVHVTNKFVNSSYLISPLVVCQV